VHAHLAADVARISWPDGSLARKRAFGSASVTTASTVIGSSLAISGPLGAGLALERAEDLVLGAVAVDVASAARAR
jgi:hypothetical protein